MCGIVGYIGKAQAAPILLDGLAKLEYRGYDSAGISIFDGENILEGEIFLKGRIYGVVLIKIAIELYFNKNIKYVIHRWRHKEVNHGERE